MIAYRPPKIRDLPAWATGKLYFGMPSVYDGYLYESEYDYLAERNLLFPEEIAIFDKFGSVINVHVQPGDLGKCPPCWGACARHREKDPVRFGNGDPAS